MIYSRVAGTGSYLPKKIMTNKDLEKFLDTTHDWIVERTGIHQRHRADSEETTSMMATAAAFNALEMAGISKTEIDLIIVATTVGDKVFPSVACHVQEKLGISDCPAFDINAVCSGFNYAVGIADRFVRTGGARCALVIGSEVFTQLLDWKDRSTCILFGDGAGAVILTAADKPGIISTHLHAAGKYKDLLYADHAKVDSEGHSIPIQLKMEGNAVFKIAVNSLEELVVQTLEANHLPQSKIDWLIPHQANLRIISAIAKKLNIPMEKVIVTVDKHANTSAASVPLALDVGVRDGRIKRGDTLLLESFGGGLTWASVLMVF